MIRVLTIIYSGSSSLGEFDLKKIIALSTLSHIRLMFFAVAIGSIGVGLLHMIIHAVFKSMLFIVAGVIIHHSDGVQDVRRLSVWGTGDPVIEIALLTRLMRMVGLPFLAGFFSKEIILALSREKIGSIIFFYIAAGFTRGYSFRIIGIIGYNTPSPLSSVGKWGLLFSFGTLCRSILAGVMSSFFLREGLVFFSVLSLNIKFILLLSLLLGGVIGVIAVGFTRFPKNIFKLVRNIWIADGVNFSLLWLSRVNSWNLSFFHDVKGILDLPLSKGVGETSGKMIALSFPSPLQVMRVLCVCIALISFIL